MSDNAKDIGITTIICVAILSAIFQMSGCVKEQTIQERAVIEQCIKNGGSWLSGTEDHCVRIQK